MVHLRTGVAKHGAGAPDRNVPHRPTSSNVQTAIDMIAIDGQQNLLEH